MFNLKFIFKILLILSIIRINQLQQSSQICSNPNRTTGKCISIYYCSVLYESLSKVPLTDNDISFLRASQCVNGVGPHPQVCCTNETSYTFDKTTDSNNSKPIPDKTTDSNNTKPIPTDELLIELNKQHDSSKLPSLPKCGPSILNQRIYNGKDADIGEFQWMALLEYKKKNGAVIQNCAGSLINSKYILTAAHCIKGKIFKSGDQLISVRLGEHDLRTMLDCDDPTLEYTCADAPVTVEVDEIIPHEGYNDTSPHRYHDIGLIRLKNHVNYTNFIRPICLPSAVNLLRTIPDDTLVVSGWGRTVSAPKADVKQKLEVPVVDQSDCAEKFATQNVKIIDDQLCAGGEFYKDSCDGDSGGPLMKRVNLHWVIEGVVSFGYKCGLEHWPAIYTRVSGYEDWIRSKLKP